LIAKTDIVLDVGFWGQGVQYSDKNWVHKLLHHSAREVYGIDLNFDPSKLDNPSNYKIGNAENFAFDIKFDVIFAADLIEHLSNPGLFLESCKKNLRNGGRLIITTPNCFNLFNMAEKVSKQEPTVNSDHTCYFNVKTLKQLLDKNSWHITKTAFIYKLDSNFNESFKKKFLNLLYFVLAKLTPKFLETLVIVAGPNIDQ